MKLRNKKTREIGYLVVSKDIDKLYVCNGDWHACGKYNSVTELNEEWEDYEEPKTEFYITAWGDIREYTTKEERFAFKQKLEIGNCFETREEAEQAVEKLKAWKRLKDKGFRFGGWKRDERFYGDYTIEAQDYTTCDDKDLDLLFGGEE